MAAVIAAAVVAGLLTYAVLARTPPNVHAVTIHTLANSNPFCPQWQTNGRDPWLGTGQSGPTETRSASLRGTLTVHDDRHATFTGPGFTAPMAMARHGASALVACAGGP